MSGSVDLLPGTLDMILKAVSLGEVHGYGVLLRIEQISDGALQIQQGALYPALYRLEHRGLISSEWGRSENNRRTKYYSLTNAGRRQLGEEVASWNRLTEAIATVLQTSVEPQKAARQARIEFGSTSRYAEEGREARGLGFFDAMRSDLRFASRSLRQHPVFTACQRRVKMSRFRRLKMSHFAGGDEPQVV